MVGCALIFLYNHLDAFPEPLRLDTLQWLHAVHFERLAMHWSRVVRAAFMYIVVLKAMHYEPEAPLRGSSSKDSIHRNGSSAASLHRPPSAQSGASHEYLPRKCPSVDNLVAVLGGGDSGGGCAGGGGGFLPARILCVIRTYASIIHIYVGDGFSPASSESSLERASRSHSHTSLHRGQAREVEYALLRGAFEEPLSALLS